MKGRDWYDLVWYISRYPEVRLNHLETRMRQSGDYIGGDPLTLKKLHKLLHEAVDHLGVEQARAEVATFIRDKRSLDVWSREFFRQILSRIVVV